MVGVRTLALAVLYLPCWVADKALDLIDTLDERIDAKIEERIDAYLDGQTAALIEEVFHDG